MKNEGRNHTDESLDIVKQYLKAEGLTEPQAETAVISMPRSLNASYVTGGKKKRKTRKVLKKIFGKVLGYIWGRVWLPFG